MMYTSCKGGYGKAHARLVELRHRAERRRRAARPDLPGTQASTSANNY